MADDLFSVAGKSAIVTGASSGLGITFAEALAARGARVMVAARREANLAELVGRIEAAGGKAIAQRCDVCDPASVRDLVAAAWEAFGRVDILVNNAGVSADGGVMPEKLPDEIFALTLQTNLAGTFYACREVGARQLADGLGGSIINVASVMGMGGYQHGPAAYQSSKAGVINLTRNLGLSWADRGVRVNCISPGWFPSEMTAGWFAVPQFLERFRTQAPSSRIGDANELVGALIFLASDAASFVTGQTIAVDGGLSASVGAIAYDDELLATQAAVVGELGSRILPNA
ncbi:MAG: SDR family oxidoreductase [Dehalococcoidia bacterium]|nr:SDR family oxidoreductase [Dehalococcoidia bacterium]